jgi:hypothetical protein
MRKILIVLALLCGAAGPYANAADAEAWCEGNDRITFSDGHFYLNGKQLPDQAVEDATEEDGIESYEYDGRLFIPCP